MKSSDPPALATWLLDHLTPRGKNDSLAGDLLEDFRQRRSVSWYWRQVFGAIFVAFSTELRARWFAVLFAILWTCAFPLYWKSVMLSPLSQSVLGWGVGHDWPESLLYVAAVYIAENAAIVWAGLTVYLVIMRSLRLQGLLRGFLVGLLAVVLVHVVGFYFIGRHQSLFARYIVILLPLFLELLLSMWASQRDCRRIEAKTVPE